MRDVAAWACATVAVLAANLGAQTDAGLRSRMAGALARARPILLEHLRLQHGGVLALVCLAAAHDGLTTEDKTFARAIRKLARARLVDTYDVALRLMVMANVEDFPGREDLVDNDTATLLAHRMRGGFTYAERWETWDLSNTQYAALGLRAAAALGKRIDPDVWHQLAKAVLGRQADDGGFGYTKKLRRHRPYASMTVAGIAVLRICARQLGRAAPAEIEDAIDRAWEWMVANRYEVGNFNAPSSFYFHYGLERAAILCDVEQLAERDWYRAGATMLVDQQLDSGAWRSFREIRPGALPGDGSPVDTAFAILFLRRKFAKNLRPPWTGTGLLLGLTDNASPAEVETATKALVLIGRDAVPDALRALHSVVRPQRQAAIEALRTISGTDFEFEPRLSPADNSAGIKAAELWWLRSLRRETESEDDKIRDGALPSSTETAPDAKDPHRR